VNLDVARAFLRDHHHAVLVTRRRDGSAQLSPVAVGIDGAGRAVVSTRETAMKAHNVRRDPAVSLCVLSEGFFGPWIQLDGRAAVESLPEAMDGLVAYYRSVAGEHPDWNDYRATMQQERRVLLRIDLDRAGPDRSG